MATKFKTLATDIIDSSGRARLDALKAALPSATVESIAQPVSRRVTSLNENRGEGQGFYLRLPEKTVEAIKIKAIEQKTTARVLVLKALKSAGFPVTAEAMTDRRRKV